MSDGINDLIGSKSDRNIVSIQAASVETDAGELLRNVCFEMRQGEFVYLIGRSGTGKTSLLRAMYGDLAFSSGKASVCGFDMMNLSRRKVHVLRRKLGIVFQDYRLLTDRSVYDNLYFVLKATGWNKRSVIDEQVVRVLQSVGMADKAQRMPNELSEGERQRVAVARALINNPDLILADEPTGNLDPITSSEVIGLLRRVCEEEGRSVLVVTHDFMMIDKYQARVVCCEKGTLK